MSSLSGKILIALLFWLVNAQQLVAWNIADEASSGILQASAVVVTRSSTTYSSFQGVIDAHNDPPLSWVSYVQEASGHAYAQPFTPSLPIITAVDIALAVWAKEGTNVTVEIMERMGNSTGTMLASSERFLFPENASYYHFSFSPPAAVTPGKEYLIVLKGPPEIPVPPQPHMTRKNLVLFVLIIEKMWKGPYLMYLAANGTLIPFQYASVLRPALMFRTYGLEEEKKLPATTTVTEPTASVTSQNYGYAIAIIIAGLATYAGLILYRRRRKLNPS